MIEAYPAAAPVEDRRGPSPAVLADLRAGAVVAAGLTVLGAALGLVWALWSPPGPAAEVFGGGSFQPDETESFVAGDGRFLVIAAAVGLAAALAAWLSRRNRGPLLLTGLAVGGVLGSLLMELVGHLTGGGSATGPHYRFSDGSVHEITKRLPLSLHTQGLVFVEAAVAALVYGILVAFTARDDLGRDDPVRAALLPASVAAGDQAQDGGRHGDAAGALQQGDLPPQQP